MPHMVMRMVMYMMSGMGMVMMARMIHIVLLLGIEGPIFLFGS